MNGLPKEHNLLFIKKTDTGDEELFVAPFDPAHKTSNGRMSLYPNNLTLWVFSYRRTSSWWWWGLLRVVFLSRLTMITLLGDSSVGPECLLFCVFYHEIQFELPGYAWSVNIPINTLFVWIIVEMERSIKVFPWGTNIDNKIRSSHFLLPTNIMSEKLCLQCTMCIL